MPEQKRMNRDERLAFMWLKTLSDAMDRYAPSIEKRLIHGRTINRYAIRNLKTARTHIRNAFEVLKASMSPDERKYVEKNCADYETRICPRKVTTDATWMYITTDDTQMLANKALQSDCALCVCGPQEQEMCSLRKTLRNLISEPDSKFGCGYIGGTVKRKDVSDEKD